MNILLQVRSGNFPSFIKCKLVSKLISKALLARLLKCMGLWTYAKALPSPRCRKENQIILRLYILFKFYFTIFKCKLQCGRGTWKTDKFCLHHDYKNLNCLPQVKQPKVSKADKQF